MCQANDCVGVCGSAPDTLYLVCEILTECHTKHRTFQSKRAKIMPVYEYACKQCGLRFDKLQPFSAAPLTECENCGQGPIRRVFQPVGVIFKGSGWYITDSRKSESAKSDSAASAAKSSGTDTAAKSDDTKPTSDSSTPASATPASATPTKAATSDTASAD